MATTTQPSVHRPRRTSALLFGSVIACSVSLGCSFEPGIGSREYQLSDANTASLEEAFGESFAATAGAQVNGALEMLFGTPSDPQFLVTEDWYDEEYDPNFTKDVLSDEVFDEMKEGNLQRFSRQLHLIAERRYADVDKPLYADDLWASWTEEYLPALLENPDEPYDPDDSDYGTWHEEAQYLFESHYPTLRESAEMYRAQCLHRHGNEGGGNGPTADYLNPRPRDYRLGVFKWVAVDRNMRPRREDLYKILHDGAYFTAMPSFARFSRGELEGLVDYVQLLSMRGEVESLLVGEVLDEEYVRAESVLENYDLVWSKWDSAEENYVAYGGDVPQPGHVTPEMLDHGRELFLGNVANCYTCHGTDGRGNGESIFEPDPDGATEINAEGEEVAVLIKRKDEWGNDSDPRNFHLGIFRGGSRPIDLFRRVKYGISGTIMPAADSSLTDDDLWSIVYYVLSIAEENDVNRRLEARFLARANDDHGHDDHGGDHDDSHGDDSHHGEDEHHDDDDHGTHGAGH